MKNQTLALPISPQQDLTDDKKKFMERGRIMFTLHSLAVFIFTLVFLPPIHAQTLCDFTVFEDGALALADEVNCNFATLQQATNTNRAITDLLSDDIAELSSANIVRVAKTNAKFSDIQSALASINDASVENPYLLFVEPGVYQTEDIILKNNVHIMGSGKQATKLECEDCSAVLNWFGNGDFKITVSNLSITNTGGTNGVNFLDFGDICRVTLDSVEIRISSGTGGPSAAINGSGCSMEIRDASVYGSAADGNAAYGVYAADTFDLDVENSYLSAAFGEPSAAILATNVNYVELKDLDIRINGGNSASMINDAYGVSVIGKESGRAGYYFDDVRIDVTARNPVAVRALNGANVKIADSRLHADTLDDKNGASYALQVEGTETLGGSTFSSEARVATSELKGIRRCINGCARICVVQSYSDAFVAIPDGCAGP